MAPPDHVPRYCLKDSGLPNAMVAEIETGNLLLYNTFSKPP